MSKKQIKAYRKLIGHPKTGQIAVKGYHTGITDGKDGLKIKDEK